jgi:hypothetical protein
MSIIPMPLEFGFEYNATITSAAHAYPSVGSADLDKTFNGSQTGPSARDKPCPALGRCSKYGPNTRARPLPPSAKIVTRWMTRLGQWGGRQAAVAGDDQPHTWPAVMVAQRTAGRRDCCPPRAHTLRANSVSLAQCPAPNSQSGANIGPQTRNGFEWRSVPNVLPGPWPQMNATSSPSGRSLVLMALISAA